MIINDHCKFKNIREKCIHLMPLVHALISGSIISAVVTLRSACNTFIWHKVQLNKQFIELWRLVTIMFIKIEVQLIITIVSPIIACTEIMVFIYIFYLFIFIYNYIKAHTSAVLLMPKIGATKLDSIHDDKNCLSIFSCQCKKIWLLSRISSRSSPQLSGAVKSTIFHVFA